MGLSTSTRVRRRERASGSSCPCKRLGVEPEGSTPIITAKGCLVLLAAVEQLADQARDRGEVLRLVQEVVRFGLERGDLERRDGVVGQHDDAGGMRARG